MVILDGDDSPAPEVCVTLPRADSGNPYLEMLTRGLRECGIRVTETDSRADWVRLAWRNHGRPRIAHIHWINRGHVARTKLKACIRVIFFIGALLLIRCGGSRIVWTVHNLVHHERVHSYFERLVQRILVRLADRLIVHCDAARVAVGDRFGKGAYAKSAVIPHGTYVGVYEQRVQRTEARERLGLDAQNFVFALVGQIRPYKGVQHLITAFQGCEQMDWRLVLAGCPLAEDYAAILRSMAASDTRISMILKFIPDDELQILFSAADVIVLPFVDVLTSGSMVLAMSFGKPMIAVAKGCAGELMAMQAGDLAVAEAEPALLRAAMHRACSLGDELPAIGAKNFEIARQWQWSDVGRMTARVYREACGLI